MNTSAHVVMVQMCTVWGWDSALASATSQHFAQHPADSLMLPKESKSCNEEPIFCLLILMSMSMSCLSESRKPSRWDTSKQEKKEDSISEFLSLARSKVGPPKQESSPLVNKEGDHVKELLSNQVCGAPRFSSSGQLWPLPFYGDAASLLSSRGQQAFVMKNQILK